MQTTKTTITKRNSHKGRTIILSIIFLLAAGIIGAIWYWNTHKKAIIKNKIETAIAEKTKGLYQVKYDSLDLNEISGWLTMYNLHLSYDSAKYIAAEKTGNVPPLLFNIFIPEINVTGIKTPKALLGDQIIGRKIEIKNPVIDIRYTYKGKDSARNIPTQEVYQQILGNLDLIQLDTVLITNAQITTSNHKTGNKMVRMQNVTFRMTDLKIDSLSYADSSRLLFARTLDINSSKINWSSPNKMYNYSADNLSVSSVTDSLVVGKFSIIPTLGEDAFVNKLPTQDDRFDFVFNKISIAKIDMQKLMHENLNAEVMMIANSSFKIYRDLARPRDTKNRVGYYPQQVLDNIPFIFTIKKVIVANSFVEYKERNHITRNSGKVQFYNVNVNMTNFTNDKNAVKANNLMIADVTSRFLNKTPMNTRWTFYLLHPKGRFDIKGNVGAIDGKSLNALTEPMGPASIKEGYINSVDFDLKGDDYSASATVKMLYTDLKVELLEKDKGAVKTDKKFLTSFIANLIIKNSNPKKNEEPRIKEVTLERNTNRSIFFLCWKTLFKGMRETVGIKMEPKQL